MRSLCLLVGLLYHCPKFFKSHIASIHGERLLTSIQAKVLSRSSYLPCFSANFRCVRAIHKKSSSAWHV